MNKDGEFDSSTGIRPMISLIYHTHDDFDSADPSSVQDTCHIWTWLNDFALRAFL